MSVRASQNDLVLLSAILRIGVHQSFPSRNFLDFIKKQVNFALNLQTFTIFANQVVQLSMLDNVGKFHTFHIQIEDVAPRNAVLDKSGHDLSQDKALSATPLPHQHLGQTITHERLDTLGVASARYTGERETTLPIIAAS